MKLPEIPLSKLISFVEEDSPFGDITSETTIDPQNCTAVISARQDLILSGLSESKRLSEWYGLTIEKSGEDGLKYDRGDEILVFSGPVHTILLLERTLLNIMGRMSGIATETRRLQDQVAVLNPNCRIAATRKTAPGLRLMDKKAAMTGGADPHRFSLSDAILIKDNHRALIQVDEAVIRAKTAGVYHQVEAEADTIEEAVLIAKAGADIILLDNMSPSEVQKTITLLSEYGLRENIIIEVSGGITEDTLAQYAALPIDRISLGMLTHSVKNADFSLDIRK